jgi:HK97 family phage major capsid protein/HK97 family phage prohead protease
MKRAYSLLTVKAVNEDLRVIRGTATTPTPDRMGDVVEPLGVSFKNPLPLLHQHRSDEPVGTVRFDKPTKAGIDFEAKLPIVVDPGPLKDRVDTAWAEVKLGLVRGVSIGFRPVEYSFMDDGGIRFIESEVLELSLVTIPANQDATIQIVRSIDTDLLAAAGHKHASDVATPPGRSGKTAKLMSPKEAKLAKKTLAEQISAFEATRQAKSARMTEIMDAAGEKGETLDATGKEEYDGLVEEVKAVDEHLVRLRALETTNRTNAVIVAGADPEAAAAARGGAVQTVQVKNRNLPPAIGFTRYIIALARSRGNLHEAAAMARANEQWMAETPDVEAVLKAAVAAGTTTDATWAGPLVQYQNLASEFVEYLRPLTIIGRIPGFTRVPFKVKIPRMTGGATVNWVGEGKVKPLSSLAFDSLTLDFAKIAGIIPLSEELVRFSSPSAELLVRNELAQAIVQFMDSEFVDPTNASTDVSPASVTYGVTPVNATGTTAAALRADVKTLMAQFLVANLQLSSAVWIMQQQQALAISLMQTSMGNPVFPGIGVNGGTFLTIPVVASEGVPATGGSPTDGAAIILANAADILLADDGQVTIDASREASLQMDSAPDSPPTASTTLVSLWQHNMIAIKAERYINWVKRRSTAVGFIQNAKYAE